MTGLLVGPSDITFSSFNTASFMACSMCISQSDRRELVTWLTLDYLEVNCNQVTCVWLSATEHDSTGLETQMIVGGRYLSRGGILGAGTWVQDE